MNTLTKAPSPAFPSRVTVFLAVSLSVLLASASVSASVAVQADSYFLSTEITSFRSFITPASNPFQQNPDVNGIALVDSGVVGGLDQFGTTYNWSNPVQFARGTQSISFGYSPLVNPSRRLNTFSVAPASLLPVTPEPLPNSNFDVAQISFTNGQYFYKAEVGLKFRAFNLVTEEEHIWFGTALVTSNSSDPIGTDGNGVPVYDPYLEADMVTIEGNPEFGSLRVFELVAQPPGNPGVTGTAILQGHIGSLDLVGFSGVSGAGFLDPSVTTIPETTSPVPLPASVGLMIAGLGALLRRRNARAA